MIPAWLDPEVSALAHLVIYGECSGGPHDGHRQAVTGDCQTIWVGPVKSAWVIEAGLPEGTAAAEGLHRYDWHGRVTDDGTRIYDYAPGA